MPGARRKGPGARAGRPAADTAAPGGGARRSRPRARPAPWDAEEDVWGVPEGPAGEHRGGLRALRHVASRVKSKKRHKGGTGGCAHAHAAGAQPRAARAPAAARARAAAAPARARARRRDPGAVRAVDVRRAVVAARGLRARRADARARAPQRRPGDADARRRSTSSRARDYWPFALASRDARRALWLRRAARRPTARGDGRRGAHGARERSPAAASCARTELEALVGKDRAPRRRAVGRSRPRAAVGDVGAAARRPVRARRGLDRAAAATAGGAAEHLVRRYLAGFGPASRKDVASFTGLALRPLDAGARAGSSCAASRARTARSCSTCPARPLPDPETPAPPRFLPTWDATLLVHARRTGVLPEEHRPKLFSTRRRTRSRRSSSTARSPARGATRTAGSRSSRSRRSRPATRRALRDEAERLAAFHA